MAQAGYTPILIYASGTGGNTPAAGNLTSGANGAELAINYFDGKLFYKDNAGVVQIIGVKMPSGVLPEANGGTGQSSYATGDLLYATGATTLSKLTIGAATTVLTSSGTAPQWVALSSTTVGTATNLAGGAAGSVPYQTGAGATTFLSLGTAGQVLQVNAGATAPEWVSSSGTGNVARVTSPSFTTPSLGAATATSINKVAFTAPASGSTLTIADGKTLTANNSLTLAGTDGTTMTFPSTSASIARTDAAQTFTGTQTFAPAANTSAIVSSAYSLTGSNAQPMLDLSGTWNTTANVNGIDLTITDTASGASSNALRIRGGAAGTTTLFSLSKAGAATFGNRISVPLGSAAAPSIVFGTTNNLNGIYSLEYAPGSNEFAFTSNINFPILYIGVSTISVPRDSSISWTNQQFSAVTGQDLFLRRDSGNVLAQRNGVNAQTFRIYNTFTDASNYERGFVRWNSNVFEVGSEQAGTGAARNTAVRASNGTVATFGLGTTPGTAGTDTNHVWVRLAGNASGGTATINCVAQHFNLAPSLTGTLTLLGTTSDGNGIEVYQTGIFGKGLRTESNPSDTNFTIGIITPQFSDCPVRNTNLVGGSARSANTTNISGGHATVSGGSGASGSAGAANGGDVRLNGGQGFGTGTNGNIVIGNLRGNLQITDARDILVGSTTGTKIGTATTQKLGFWNAAPIVQPDTSVAAATVAATGTGDVVAASTTFDGYTIPQIVKALRNAGLLA